ncbi:MAG: energy-coupling factor ABC transporter permease [Burkholderiaceae bacterium]|nr:energy-coupling factor ABC transporter permease [Burkholderiaceae bacterium]
MHMADTLVSPVTGTAMLAVSSGLLGYSLRKVRQQFQEQWVPLMGVMGAFVFAAQMINFVIPATGSSGHVTGIILLAALLGPYPAFLVLSTVLVLQALFFADGGLLAMGCNIFNMAFWGCFIAYPLLFKPLVNGQYSRGRLVLGSVLACMVSAQLGALGVVLETLASGITELPFSTFALLMLPIHLAIGAIEGVLTACVLLILHRAEPRLLAGGEQKIPSAALLSFLGISAVFMGGFVSLIASSAPDGLEWAIKKTSGATDIPATHAWHDISAAWQSKIAVLPDYALPGLGETLGTMLSGVSGALLTLFLVLLLGMLVIRRKKNADIP